MHIGLLSDLQLPRPWSAAGERSLLTRELDRIVLAEALGLSGAWVQEHHFLEELGHGGGATAFLGAAAARTSTIRLGLGLLSVDPSVRHPAVLASEVATLDQLCGGRLDVATGVARTGVEVAGLGLARQTARARLEHYTGVLARMLEEEPFAGSGGGGAGPAARMILPRPHQRPHPPLWLRCDKAAEISTAARLGLGALCRAVVDPDEAAEWVAEYRAVLASERCTPVAASIRPRVAVCLPMFVDADEATAIVHGLDGAHFHAYAVSHYERFGEHRPGATDLWAAFQAQREDVGLAGGVVVADGSPLGVRVFRDGRASLRGAIGTPDQVADLVARYAAAGVDDLLLVLPPPVAGRPDHNAESLRLFADSVLPRIVPRAGEEDDDAALQTATRSALARRPPRPTLTNEAISALAEAPAPTGPAAAAQSGATPADPVRSANGSGRPETARAILRATMPADLKERASARGTAAARRAVARADDRWLERTLGSARGLKLIFGAMAKRFVPAAAQGFVGTIAYELRDQAGVVQTWSVRVTPTAATATPGPAPDPALTIQMGLADFLRLAVGELDPGALLLSGRMDLRGDFGLATRLGAMFGQ
ncbi:Alkanesulfonate monooxygenase [Paraconexibacter sp. AEG42_29]|uniref:Alkanesulfonate monooxygenase n=1 Tax=Paraconexibacter sp. AEG42_29 TaxID=2997339 RepID=A0AAU7AYF5_9ACTN